MIEMTVTGDKRGDREAFHELDTFRSRTAALGFLRLQLGGIHGQSDEDYLEGLKSVGVTVSFREI